VADDFRYPIGPFETPESLTAADRSKWITDIAECATHLRAAVANLDDQQLDTPYREGGWTVRQLVHHVPDSHLNSYIRFKLALTEEDPLVRPYDENRWSQLPEARTAPVEVSLRLLEALHTRWVLVLQSMGDAEFARMYWHPEYPDGPQRLDSVLAMYAWHSRHHVAHISELRQRMGW
jgi:uncharacterized damage-inducible protein DinB